MQGWVHNSQVVSGAVLLYSYPCSPCSSLGSVSGKLTNHSGFLSLFLMLLPGFWQRWKPVHDHSLALLQDSLQSSWPRLASDGSLSFFDHFISLPTLSTYPVSGHFYQKAPKKNSKFVEIALNGQYILCGAFHSPCFFFTFFMYQTSRQDFYLLACLLLKLQ